MLNTKHIIDYIESIKSKPEAGIYDRGRNQMADRIIDFIKNQEKTHENIKTVGQLINALEYFPEDMTIASEGLPYDSIMLQIKHDIVKNFDYVCIS